MITGFLPTWGKYWKAGTSKVFTVDNARAYGRFLGRRYRDRAIIWILGGDQNVTTADERAIIDAMAARTQRRRRRHAPDHIPPAGPRPIVAAAARTRRGWTST